MATGIISRYKEIVCANINDWLDGKEDPGKMIDQHLRRAKEELADVEKDTASVMADEMGAKRRLEACQAEVDKFARAAIAAVQAGNDDDARKLISSKQKAEAELENAKTVYDAAKSNADKLREMHDKLVEQIEEMERRRDNIKAKVSVAKAQDRITGISSGKKAEAAVAAFDRMEQKADKMLDEAQARSELASGRDTGADELAEKYTGKGGSASVEAELAAMRASVRGTPQSVDAELEAMKAGRQ